MVNKWIEHVKKFANDNNMTYACAVSDKLCRDAYKPQTPLKSGGGDKCKKCKNDDKLESLRGEFDENYKRFHGVLTLGSHLLSGKNISSRTIAEAERVRKILLKINEDIKTLTGKIYKEVPTSSQVAKDDKKSMKNLEKSFRKAHPPELMAKLDLKESHDPPPGFYKKKKGLSMNIFKEK